MKKSDKQTLGSVPYYPDRLVGCPICQQEFWGYSEIIFCRCGWTFIREEDLTGETLALPESTDIEISLPAPRRQVIQTREKN